MADESTHAAPADPGGQDGYTQPWGQQPYEQPAWGQQPGAYPPPGYPPPGYPPVQQGPQTETLAIVSLILSVAGTMMAPVLAHIAALILAPMAKRNIRASGGRLTGEGLAVAAQVVSWIVIAGAALLVIGYIALIIWAVSQDSGY